MPTLPFVARCPCGACEIELDAVPRVRFLCHCTICQSVYPGDYADATMLRADRTRLLCAENLLFKKLAKPPALDRGVCDQCNHPVIGFLESGFLPTLAFVPTAVLPDGIAPPPLRHVYYGTRVTDVDDDLPKTHGELASQLSLILPFLRTILSP